eukprot:GEMP01005334.1.p1 GENE.GEMP01005334.1~~GEMP01005334.1.p1  ORF type:complete len:679 (+),score=118.41 GEMP01005334.1:119-2155(+)
MGCMASKLPRNESAKASVTGEPNDDQVDQDDDILGSSPLGTAKPTKLVLGKYEVVRGKKGHLGEGSFSVVQKGWDLKTQAEVAVKFYKVDRENKEEFNLATKKFKRQISVLQNLAKPMVKCKNSRLWHNKLASIDPDTCFLKLIDYSKTSKGEPGPDVSDGNLYVVTEVADLSLKDLLSHHRETQTPVPSASIRDIIRHIITVVAALHAKGLAHLDIKPENLMRAGEHWKLIDVDGCSELESFVNINDSSISFSPCYCAPEWARFLIEDSETLRVHDGLDVWSVGISICELLHLDAVLKPTYAKIFREYGSHRKAGFLFLEWLSKTTEALNLPDIVQEAEDEFRDLIVEKMLTKDPTKRITLAECLDHPLLQGVAHSHSAQNAEWKKVATLRAQRMQEPDSEKPPLMKGVLYKMNLDGDLMNSEHWLKRDLWLAHNGALCYFSPKHNKRLIYLAYEVLVRAKVATLPPGSSSHEFAFEINYPCTSDEAEVAEFEVARFAAETEKDRKAWVKHLTKIQTMQLQNLKTLNFSRGLISDFRNFKLTIRNRRAELPDGDQKAFKPRYKAALWKLNQDGDVMNPEHWLQREMWIATNGALCYHSKKENRELQYYTSQDMRRVTTCNIREEKAAKPNAFEIRLPPADGLEYAPGVFAALSAAERKAWIEQIAALSKRSNRPRRD